MNGKRKSTGISMIEVVVSTMIVAIMLVSALRTLSSVIRGRVEIRQQHHAALLASQLLEEILVKDYSDLEGPAALGHEIDETRRSEFDDVDDYDRWSETPPQDRNGETLPGLSGWTRESKVVYVDPRSPTRVVRNDRGAKRITVSVHHDGKWKVSLEAVRSNRT